MSEPEKCDADRFMPRERRAFRWVIDSRENDKGVKFPSFTMSTVSWSESGVELGYHKCPDVVTVDEWLAHVSAKFLDIKFLDAGGSIIETYRLSWADFSVIPFDRPLDYTSSDRLAYAVFLRGIHMIEVK